MDVGYVWIAKSITVNNTAPTTGTTYLWTIKVNCSTTPGPSKSTEFATFLSGFWKPPTVGQINGTQPVWVWNGTLYIPHHGLIFNNTRTSNGNLDIVVSGWKLILPTESTKTRTGSRQTFTTVFT